MRDPAHALADEVARAARRPGARRTLLLDLDGTLAPIAPRPEAARVPRETLAALGKLVGAGWWVAIVSGRPAEGARRLVPVRGVRIFGCHGAEGPKTADLPPGLSRRLAALAAAALPLAARTRGARVEVKPAAIAFHDREVPRGALPAWRRSMRALLAAADLEGLEVLRGRRVLEVRPQAVHKGMVLRNLARAGGDDGPDASLVALGDDRTDEDLFRALRGRGLAVRVGRHRASTAAVRRLASPAATRRFLERLVAGGDGGRK